MLYPKISIVTPSYNQGKYLEQTILSILDQSYPNLEYIIVDGGSTDNSVDIIKKYESNLSYWVSEKDNGLYHAIAKGFKLSTGDIMGWLNSDDMLHRNSLITIAEILSLNSVEWIQGHPTVYDEYGRTVDVVPHAKWSKFRYYLNDFKHIQQESTFWTRELWNKSGAYISTNYKYAGDMELWNRFFKYEKLYTPHCLIGGFRIRQSGQLSLEGMREYNSEAQDILDKNTISINENYQLNKIYFFKKILDFLRKSKIFKLDIINRKISNLYDFPTEIKFNREQQQFHL